MTRPKIKPADPLIRPAADILGFREGERASVERRRDQNAPWRAWYSSAAWAKLREACFVRDGLICQRTGIVCLGSGNDPDAPVANHKTPHRGDRALFFDLNNLETVSKAAHDSIVQAEENAALRRA